MDSCANLHTFPFYSVFSFKKCGENSGFVYVVHKTCPSLDLIHQIYLCLNSPMSAETEPRCEKQTAVRVSQGVTPCPHCPCTLLRTVVYDWSFNHTEVSHFCHINRWWIGAIGPSKCYLLPIHLNPRHCCPETQHNNETQPSPQHKALPDVWPTFFI